MVPGLYSAATGLNAMSVLQDVTARNLSEAMKPGYLRRVATFEVVGTKDDNLGTSPSIHTDFTPGPMVYTGNKFDVAIIGDGLFELEGPDGSLYTRNGVFQMNGQGILMNYNGMPVRGNAIGNPDLEQRITIPPGTAAIEILDDGTVIADGIAIAQLRVATFENPEDLERVGTTLFQAPNGVTPDYTNVDVRQGYRAGSNTTLTGELIQMIFGMRQFEAAQRALRTIDDAIGLSTRPRQ